MTSKGLRIAIVFAFVSIIAGFAGCGGGYEAGTPPVALAAPSGLTATGGTGQVMLAWVAPSTTGTPVSYNVYTATTAGVTPATGTKISGLTATTYMQTGLASGTTYYYIVTAVYASGESVASAQVSATTAAVIPPVPANLTATAGSAQVSLAWMTSAGATSCNVYYSTTAGVTPANGTKIAGIATPSYTQTGLVNGTTYYYVVTAVNSAGESAASAEASATPIATLTVTTATLSGGTDGSSYSGILAATGGIAPYTWSISTGALPAGLSLNASTGAISGTPTQSGTQTFTAQVRDSEATPKTATASLSLTIASGLAISTTTLASGTVNTAYSATIAATGGTAPYTWSVSTGSLPAGLSLNAGTGVISGTPTAAGTASFTIQAKDSEGIPATATTNLSIVINPAGLILTTSSLVSGTVNVAYSATLAAAGGTAPYTWSISSGSLPAGLSLAAGTGVISGLPTGSGTTSFTVQVKDSGATPAIATANLSITISPATLAITTTTVPNGTDGVTYSAPLAATGGVGPYAWSISTGSLPAGLSLGASTGTITGTPSQSGTQSFTVQAKDSAGTSQTATANFTIIISSGLSITITTLSSGTVNATYSATVPASGGTAPYTFSVSNGSLPSGLSLNTSTGAITGTPTTPGTSNFTIQAKDSEGTPQTTAANLSITINAAALIITNTSLPSGAINAAYTATLNATGGVAPYTWSVSAGSLPANLSLTPGTGVISGTPTGSGTTSFTVQVKDSSSTPAMTTADLSITVNAAGLVITTVSLPSGTLNAAYTTTLAATGGVGPYMWSVTSGSLPTGLSLNSSSGVISGTPTQFQTATFTLQAQDAETTPQTASVQVSISIYSNLAITTTGLASSLSGQSYTPTLKATGGTAPYTWSLLSGALPAGVSLSSGGAISGTPTVPGTYVFQVRVQDSETTPSVLAANFSITIQNSFPVSFSQGGLGSGTVGQGFSADMSLTNQGGTAPFTFSVLSGNLPPGLTLSAAGTLSGTPATAGSFSFIAQVVDANSTMATIPYTVVIYPATLAIQTITVQAANIGESYNVNNPVQVTGGKASYMYAITAGSLPPGLTMATPLSSSISGTPTTPGNYNFTVTVTDANNVTVSQAYTLYVVQDPPCPTGNEAALNGSYAFVVHGFSGYGIGYPEAAAFSFMANGAGGITSAEGDINVSTASGSQMTTYTNASSYSVGANGQGCATLVNASGGTATVAFTLGGFNSGVATRGRIISFDSAARGATMTATFGGAAHTVGILGGTMLRQTTSNFALSALSANFAFGLTGSDVSIGHFGLVGSLTNSAGGIFTNVFADSNDSGVVASALSGGSGGFNGTPDTQGRLHATISVGGASYSYVAYIVDANTVFLVSSDAISVNPIASGSMLATSASFSSASVSGNYIFAGAGADSTNSAGARVALGILNFGANGTAWSGTEYQYERDCSCGDASAAPIPLAGTYTVGSASGRVTLTGSGGGSTPVIYLVNAASGIDGFLLDTSSGAGATAYEGQIVAQPSGPYTESSMYGTFIANETNISSNLEEVSTGLAIFAGNIGTDVLVASLTTESAGSVVSLGLFTINPDGTGFTGPAGNRNILITNGTTTYLVDYGGSVGELVEFEKQ